MSSPINHYSPLNPFPIPFPQFLPHSPSIQILFIPIKIKMSISADKLKLIDASQSHQQSFFKGFEQDADLQPHDLSGDENGSQSVYSVVEGANKANFLLTVTTIIKTVIGSGILGLPFTVSKCGYVFAIIVFAIATAVTQLGSILLLKAKNLSGHSNFSTIFYHIFQNKLCKGLGSILIFMNNLGICILEIIIFKTTIRSVLTETLPGDSVLDQFYTNQIFIALVISVMEVPFILVKKIEKLRFMAFLGVSGIMVFVITFVAFYIAKVSDYTAGPTNPDMALFPTNWFQAIASIPNLLLALSFHMNFFPVYKGMRNANDRKMAAATMTGIAVCSISYLLIGILGYHLVYTINAEPKVNANFLQSLNYDQTNHIVYFIIHIGFLLSVFFAFPIMFFGCRNNFIALAQLLSTTNQQKRAKKWRENSDNIEQISSYIQSQDKVQKRKKANKLFVIYTFIIFFVIVGVGLSVDDIEVVFNIIGAVCSSSIGVLLPCAFYFLLVRKKRKPKKFTYFLSLVVFMIMLPFAIFSVVAKYV